MRTAGHQLDRTPALPKLLTLGLQHVLVMYVGAIAVPLIVGRAFQLGSSDVAFLVSADLFVCGLVTILQSLGASRWFGIRLPVIMGVTFTAVGPMVSIAGTHPGSDGIRYVFGSVMTAGFISMLIAPAMSHLLRFFPPLVTGTIILSIGISLMRIGASWIFGSAVGATAPIIVDPVHRDWLIAAASAASLPGSHIPPMPPGLNAAPSLTNPLYATPEDIVLSAIVLATIVLVAKAGRGFVANISVLIGMGIGTAVAAAIGKVKVSNIAQAQWFAPILPFHFGQPLFDPVLIVTMSLVMIVVMIESTGLFLALGELTGRPVTQPMLAAGLRADGLASIIGGLFNTFPYTSYSQNVGLVGMTGVRSRHVCVASGAILVAFGLVPKIGAIVEALPSPVLGGAAIAMFGMVAATGVKILSAVDFASNPNDLLVVGISLGLGMIPLVAPSFDQWMPFEIHPLVESGILITSCSAVILNVVLRSRSTHRR